MKALLVMDFVKEYIHGEKPLIPLEGRDRLITSIKRVINSAHERNIPVIYINSAFEKEDPIFKVIGNRPQAMKGSEGAQLIPELEPIEKDYILEKKGYDGFWKSGLEELLNRLDVTEIYLAGQQTDCCVRETGVTAVHLGYNVSVIKDCCATNRELGQESALIFIKNCVGKVIDSKELNW